MGFFTEAQRVRERAVAIGADSDYHWELSGEAVSAAKMDMRGITSFRRIEPGESFEDSINVCGLPAKPLKTVPPGLALLKRGDQIVAWFRAADPWPKPEGWVPSVPYQQVPELADARS